MICDPCNFYGAGHALCHGPGKCIYARPTEQAPVMRYVLHRADLGYYLVTSDQLGSQWSSKREHAKVFDDAIQAEAFRVKHKIKSACVIGVES